MTNEMHFEAGSSPTIINIETFNNHGTFNAGQSALSQLNQSTNVGAATDNQPYTAGSPASAAEQPSVSADPSRTPMRMKAALRAVSHDDCFRHLYDWSWVRLAMAEAPLRMRFSTTGSFLNTLRSMGIDNLPDSSVVNRYTSKVCRTADGYTFSDTTDPTETIRRNNIIRRFIAAYVKG